MKRGIVLEGLLRFMDQQRRINFSFFEGWDVRSATITIPPAKGGKVRLSANVRTVGDTLQVSSRGVVRVAAEF